MPSVAERKLGSACFETASRGTGDKKKCEKLYSVKYDFRSGGTLTVCRDNGTCFKTKQMVLIVQY